MIAKNRGTGVGESVPRKEDRRFLNGSGQFVGDIALSHMEDVAFIRSPFAHGLINNIEIPDSLRHSVYCAKDLIGTKSIRAVSNLKGFKPSDQPLLALEKVRYVGELIAACLGATRAEAED